MEGSPKPPVHVEHVSVVHPHTEPWKDKNKLSLQHAVYDVFPTRPFTKCLEETVNFRISHNFILCYSYLLLMCFISQDSLQRSGFIFYNLVRRMVQNSFTVYRQQQNISPQTGSKDTLNNWA